MAQLLASYAVRTEPWGGTTWEFDTTDDCTTAGVPISTATAYAGMTIDWGDGTITTVESVSDYVHEYAEAGKYHIVVTYDDWANVELSYSAVAVSPIAEARTSIAKVFAIPTVANTSFQHLFYMYTGLTELAADLFANNPQITSFWCTFYGCTGLTAIPENLFANNTAVTNFGNTFQNCSSLTNISENLFAKNTKVESFQYIFYGCTGLVEIPEGLFDNNTEVTTFLRTFFYCSRLATVPVELFAKNTKVESFHGVFDYTALAANTQCENGKQYFALDITSEVVTVFGDDEVPFWRPDTASVDAVYINVPEGSTTETTALTYNAEYPDFALKLNADPCSPGETWEFDTVEDCSTVGVPISRYTAYAGMTIDWGDGNVTTVASVDDYTHTYETPGQYHITVLYDDWENVELDTSDSDYPASPIGDARTGIAKIYAIPRVANTSFQMLFYMYTALKEVAADLFANNPQVTSLDSTFSMCTGLTSIPSGLFDNNTANTTFNAIFYGCSSLVSIPSGLFDNNTEATIFSSIFYACTSLESIPSGLFDNNTKATTFANVFAGCSLLASIPERLFDKHTLVTSFRYAFFSCSNLENQSVYIASEIVTDATRFMNSTGDGNTVYVPEGTTTESTFNSASYVGCTVATY